VTETKFLEVSDFMLQKGGFLPSAKLAYRTIGKLNAAKDNAILIPSWYTGTDADSEMFLCGPDRALNPKKYFIVLTNLLGNGISSSPSNTPAPFDRARFPKVTFYDNVRLQHQLVTEELGLKSLRLVTGWSMGASQTYQWAAQYPDMVRAAAPIAGSARTASFNKVFLLSLRRALELDPSFEDGFYERPPIRGLRAFASIYAGWGVSEAFYRTGAYSAFAAKSHEEFVQYFWEPFFQRCDANNLLSQLWTWEQGDISDNPLHNGDFEAALRAIKARTIILPVDLDRYFPPVDAEYEAKHIPRGVCRVAKSIWGHMAPINPGDVSGFDPALTELLNG
jgi:homoserine O-acetyltransferase/O-succinyltransferase